MKPITGVVVHVNGNVEVVLVKGIATIQEIVGGYFEVLRSESGETMLWINEDGKVTGLRPNVVATRILWNLNPAFRDYDYIAGPALITGGADHEGETLDISEEGKNAVEMASY